MGNSKSAPASSRSPVVLVTGCSKGGIGYELCIAFQNAKCKVFASARRLETIEELHELGIYTLKLDVTLEDSIKSAVLEIIDKEGRIDILVNNAGVSCPGPLAELPISEMRSLFEANLFGVIATVQAVFPHMAKQGSGKIVNVGSVVGYVSTPWSGIYSASKAALHSITDTLRLELKPFGISTMLVAPGAVSSNLIKKTTVVLKTREWQFYKPFELLIIKRPGSQLPQYTPADEFAGKTVQAVLKDKLVPHFSFGKFSFMFGVFRWLPTWLLDVIKEKNYGLDAATVKKLGFGQAKPE